MPQPFASAIYTGIVSHRRMRPRTHQLRYGVFALVLDLDELPRLDREIAGFGHNRFSLLAFYDRDHGAGADAPLRGWVEGHLSRAGIDLNGGAIRLMCYPRILGYVFNPISVYFCYRREGDGSLALAALLYEVSNTFRQRHTYLIPVTETPGDGIVRQSCAKQLYVSPFVPMNMTYFYRVRPPAESMTLRILEQDHNGPLLVATFAARRQEISTTSVLRSFFRYPLLTLKVIGGIHWEALKLWAKGIPLVHRPGPPITAVSIVTSGEGTIAAVSPPGL